MQIIPTFNPPNVLIELLKNNRPTINNKLKTLKHKAAFDQL